MKWLTGLLVLAVLFGACNSESNTTERKLDSLEERIDTTAEKVWDSTKSKAKELKERIENRLERRDSAGRRDTIKKD